MDKLLEAAVDLGVPKKYLRDHEGYPIGDIIPDVVYSVFDFMTNDLTPIMGINTKAEFYFLYHLKLGEQKYDMLKDQKKIFPSIDQYEAAFKVWYSKYENEVNSEREEWRNMKNRIKELAKYGRVVMSDPRITESLVHFVLKGYEYNPLADLFNASSTSEMFPFIQFVEKNLDKYIPYTRIHRDMDVKDIKTPPTEECIIFKIRYGKELQEGKLTYRDGGLSFYIPKKNTEDIIERVCELFMVDIPEDYVTLNVSGEFTAYKVDLTDYVLYDMITNEDIVSDFFHLRESGKPSEVKDEIKIYCGDSSIVIDSSIIFQGTVYEIRGTDYHAESTIPILKISIKNASDESHLSKLGDLLSCLMRYYLHRKDEIIHEYSPLLVETAEAKVFDYNLPERYNTKDEVIDYYTEEVDKNDKLPILINYSGPIIGNDYARNVCQTYKPSPVTPQMEEKVRKLGFNIMEYNKEVVKTKYYEKYIEDSYSMNRAEFRQKYSKFEEALKSNYKFMCPYEKQKTPDLNLNKEEDGKIPAPCCYVIGSRSGRRGAGGKGQAIKTNKILEDGAMGSTFSQSLKNYLGEIYPKESFFRCGVPNDRNSFLHCVLRALDDEYTHSNVKKEYTEDILDMLGGPEYLHEVMAQENPGKTKEEIREEMTTSEFFDPLRYYRLIEEIYDVNIFVVDYDHMSNKGKMNDLVKIPYHSKFYSYRPAYKSRCIIIMRHMGSESDSRSYPHCELIGMKEKNTQFVYGKDIRDHMQNLFSYAVSHSTWEIDNSVIHRMNLFSAIDYNSVFPEIVSQFIDSSGKARAFNVKVNGAIFTVHVVPTYPIYVSSDFDPVEPRSAKETITAFGEPHACTTDKNGYVDGFWYMFGDVKALYIPVEYHTGNYNVDDDRSMIMSFEEDQFTIFMTNKRAAEFLKHLCRCMFVYRSVDVETFMANYVEMYPDFDYMDLHDNYPRVITAEDLESYGKIYVKNEKMRESIRYDMLHLSRELDGLSDVKYQDYWEFPGYYTKDKTFQHDESSEYILYGTDELNKWKLRPDPVVSIDKITPGDTTRVNPFITEYKEEKLLIQNVSRHDYLQAINVAYEWATKRINPGFLASQWRDTKKPNVRKFVLTKEGHLETNDDYSPVSVVDFGSGRYAAALKL